MDRRTNSFTISFRQRPTFRPYPTASTAVTFPVALRVLMKQAGYSHEANQTTDRRRAA